MAGILPFVGAAAGLIQGLGQNSGAASNQRRALDLYADIQRREEEERARRAEVARQMLASGYGSADGQIAALRQSYDANGKIAQRNVLGAYQTMGYEAGDTPMSAASSALSARGLAQQAQLEQQAQQNAYAQMLGLQGLYSPAGVNQAAAMQAGAIAGSPVNQQADLSGVVGALSTMDYGFLKPRKRRGGEFAGGMYDWLGVV